MKKIRNKTNIKKRRKRCRS